MMEYKRSEFRELISGGKPLYRDSQVVFVERRVMKMGGVHLLLGAWLRVLFVTGVTTIVIRAGIAGLRVIGICSMALACRKLIRLSGC
jgi:hypothetical protein